ncbi:MAG: serine/threonine-protein kinase [Planctomycetota bacterium]
MTLRARQKLGKYRIRRRLANGPHADVYESFDTIEGIRVALKIPHATLVTPEMLAGFRAEVRISAGLNHPNILRIKNADFIGDRFVVAYPLGEESLAERLQRRMALSRAYHYIEQILEAVAHAHEQRVIHCDIKPENLILFPGDRIRLTDFGISKVALRTMSASGSGTVGYVAPEQALGHPRFESDVFSSGVVLYQMLARERPHWPFRWPLPGIRRLRSSAPQSFVMLLQRCLEVDFRSRYRDGRKLLAAYRRLLPDIERYLARRRRTQGAIGRGR